MTATTNPIQPDVAADKLNVSAAALFALFWPAYLAGKPVASITARCDDAGVILEGGGENPTEPPVDDEGFPNEFLYPWREVTIDPALLPVLELEGMNESDREYTQRNIAAIAEHEAGAFTETYPPLVQFCMAETFIMDGWKRIKVAQKQRVPKITMLVALVPQISHA